MEEIKSERLILVAENSQEHSQLIQKALLEHPFEPKIISISDGTAVMEFLLSRSNATDSSLPNLILLDLGISGKTGIEVLSEIKAHPRLRRIPVVVLALSSRAEDILKSYTLQGNCYVVKSQDMDQLFDIVKRIEEFWLGIATLPTA